MLAAAAAGSVEDEAEEDTMEEENEEEEEEDAIEASLVEAETAPPEGTSLIAGERRMSLNRSTSIRQDADPPIRMAMRPAKAAPCWREATSFESRSIRKAVDEQKEIAEDTIVEDMPPSKTPAFPRMLFTRKQTPRLKRKMLRKATK